MIVVVVVEEMFWVSSLVFCVVMTAAEIMTLGP
jgi:hypothetical protein